MKVLSLFSGIGGIDLGLERAGHTVVAQSEIDPYCCRVLAKHWPDVPNLGDVTTIDWNDHHGLGIELVAGGYPCQPFSLASAGKRKGSDDVRHLWPYMADAIRVLRPRYAVMENVPGHLSSGFGRVLGDLAEIGYDAEWDCISAASVGAPHRRDRVWIVAHPSSARRRQDAGSTLGNEAANEGRPTSDDHVANGDGESRRAGYVADADIMVGTSPEPVGRRPRAMGEPGTFTRVVGCGISWDAWAVEPDVGRVAHGVPHRVDRLRALGNAVVPQVAEHIGRMLAVA